MATMTVILGEPPYSRERAYLAMRFIMAAMNEGHRVHMFLFEEAVRLPLRGDETAVVSDELKEKYDNCENLMKSAVDMGANVKICGICARERKLNQDELIAGVTVGAMQDLIKWIMQADKVVSF